MADAFTDQDSGQWPGPATHQVHRPLLIARQTDASTAGRVRIFRRQVNVSAQTTRDGRITPWVRCCWSCSAGSGPVGDFFTGCEQVARVDNRQGVDNRALGDDVATVAALLLTLPFDN